MAIQWTEVVLKIQDYGAVLAILANFYLLGLINYRSPEQLGNYKYLMMYISIFEIFYSIIGVALHPAVYTYKSAYIIFVDVRSFALGRDSAAFLNVLFCALYEFSMAVFGINFIYRYAITRGFAFGQTTKSHRALFRLKSYFEGAYFAIWLLIPVFYTLFWILVIDVCFGPFDEFSDLIRYKLSVLKKNNRSTELHLRGPLLENFDIQLADIVYLGPYFFPVNRNGTRYTNYTTVVGMFSLTASVMLSAFCVIFFGIKCYWGIYKIVREFNSSNYRGLQRQLFEALVMQTAIPFILMYIPGSVLYMLPLLDMDFGFVTTFISITIAIYPAIDPLPTIFIVKKYRLATIEIFKGLARILLFDKRSKGKRFSESN
ncbi:unnamed protein product [Caenorhabditis bovis]|uniref:Seven TM Receptor n=1 Tax=Caenorhabditis bovis TaxID=2654633 RepID=A0A8S1F5Z4_9PELO|nr:unnamed protein product [Caenorhabditis bovis]